jgi:hypothetical protein
MNAADAAPIMAQAFALEVGREPSRVELDGLLAVARLETHFGSAWDTEAGAASHNWGAIQAGRNRDGSCPVGSFGHGDTHPTATGDRAYTACFRSYPSDVDGARDVVRTVRRTAAVAAALRAGDVLQLSRAMYRAGYYEGHGATPAERIAGHARLFWGAMAANQRERGRPLSWRYRAAGSSRTAKAKLLGPLVPVALAILRGAR